MESENLKSFADRLRGIRENQGVTLQQIKLKTRIDMKYLEAIEVGDFEIMPQVYMRAFIKEYAESIGLNGQETLDEYESIREGKKFEKTVSDEPVEEKIEFSDAATQTPIPNASANDITSEPWFMPSIAIAAIIIIATIIYFAFFNSADEELITEKPYQEIVKEKQQRFEVIEEDAKPAAKEIEPVSLELKIVAVDTSWVQVTADSDSTTDFILYPKRKKTFSAKENFELVIGNSAGVKLVLNSDTLNLQGVYKKAKRVLINSEGLKYLPMKSKKSNEG